MVLAPMEDVTDTVFRRVVLETGGIPDLMFTEFTNVEGVQSRGREHVIHRLKYIEEERPLIAQIWGITPEDYYNTAKYILELGYDGIDINMGCPVKKIIKKGACSALIKNPALAKEIVLAVKEGVSEKIPTSIKTRIGFNSINTEEWITFLLKECQPEALTVHGRTVKEMSSVPNHWEEIAKISLIREQYSPNTIILGNGDVMSLIEAYKKAEENNLDGIMIGRGIFHNPWLFNENLEYNTIDKNIKINLLKYHLKLWNEEWGQIKNFAMLKRFIKIYIKDFDGAKEIRTSLMEIKNLDELTKEISKL